jgi:hypothetical protein
MLGHLFMPGCRSIRRLYLVTADQERWTDRRH